METRPMIIAPKRAVLLSSALLTLCSCFTREELDIDIDLLSHKKGLTRSVQRKDAHTLELLLPRLSPASMSLVVCL